MILESREIKKLFSLESTSNSILISSGRNKVRIGKKDENIIQQIKLSIQTTLIQIHKLLNNKYVNLIKPITEKNSPKLY